jgi:hypothetical protein
MTTVLTGLNVNWKLGFLLLIPLFYRTIGEVLERIEEGPGGTKFPKAKKPKSVDPIQSESEGERRRRKREIRNNAYYVSITWKSTGSSCTKPLQNVKVYVSGLKRI